MPQITPNLWFDTQAEEAARRHREVLGRPRPGAADRAMKAMLGMRKIDIAAIEAAADGK